MRRADPASSFALVQLASGCVSHLFRGISSSAHVQAIMRGMETAERPRGMERLHEGVIFVSAGAEIWSQISRLRFKQHLAVTDHYIVLLTAAEGTAQPQFDLVEQVRP